MLKSADPTISSRRSRVPAGLVVALAVGSQCGCTREFFREWANQDATEIVFEKSRDPRWRIELFSVEPPALSRFASYGDPDNPPAPPDDYATEAMSPVPQWPDQRLLVAMEGTGYLDMLEAWRAENPEPPPTAPRARPAAPSTIEPAPPLPPPSVPSSSVPPFSPGGNSGPAPGSMPPSNVPGPPAANPPSGDAVPPQAHTKTRDNGVRLAAFQQTGIPLPATQPLESGATPSARPAEIQPPPVGMDPDPINRDLSAPVRPRQDLTPDQYRASEEAGSEMAGMLVPDVIDFDDAEASGLPRNSRPYRLTMEQAFRLALINARVYQFQLENVYTAALAVTTQRFAFQPQFYAGNGPTTPTVAGIPSPNSPISFTYNTRETGSPLSGLSIGTVAGMGKAFNTGARLAMGFANQVVFNFLGQNAAQPTVRSFLPLTLVQPFLRGGGRAVNLEALTQAERNMVYAVRAFAKFRQEFIVATLVGGTAIQNFATPGAQTAGFSGGGNNDPVIGFLNVVQDLQQLENDIKNIAAFEKLLLVYRELIVGEASGLTQLQVDQVESNLQNARRTLVTDRTQFRSQLDSLKIQLGLPPDTPLVLDRSLTRPFKEVFDGIDQWQRNPRRNLEDLPQYSARLPNLRDVIIDGRSVLSVYTEGKNHEDDLEDLLLAAERVAFEHRLDLMTARAQLYDAWRQIRVQANALRGVFNVSLTNTFITPPATTNPFAFVDQAKQFSLVLNTELPLVRMNERNSYRGTLIGYERQRRSLQAFEDNLKVTIRNDIRNLHQQYLTYEIARKNFVLIIRQKDQAFEQIIAPPQGAAAGGGGTAQAASAATQTQNLIQAQGNLLNQENALVTNWLAYETARLALYRDLGTLPYDEWEAFHELFPPDYGRQGPGSGPQPGVGAGAAANLQPGPSGAAPAGQPAPAGR